MIYAIVNQNGVIEVRTEPRDDLPEGAIEVAEGDSPDDFINVDGLPVRK